jgi:hypothetical protein
MLTAIATLAKLIKMLVTSPGQTWGILSSTHDEVLARLGVF